MTSKRPLGNSGIHIAPLALGTNVFGWTADEATSHAILDHFTASGLDLVDTADMYSRWAPGNDGGESESIIGSWLRKTGKRQGIVLATKVGADMGNGRKGLSAAYIIRAAEDSLRRLHTDYIDLYQSHFDDGEVPVEETLEAYSKLIQQGKVRAIGASNTTPERLRQSLDAARNNPSLPAYISLQPHYNLYERAGYETNWEPLCREYDLAVIPYFPLASGFLTGKYRSGQDLAKSPRGGSMGKFMNARGNAILHALDQVASTHNTSVASVALAWLMARPSITAPIASATSVSQLNDLIAATRLQLSPTEITLLNAASAY